MKKNYGVLALFWYVSPIFFFHMIRLDILPIVYRNIICCNDLVDRISKAVVQCNTQIQGQSLDCVEANLLSVKTKLRSSRNLFFIVLFTFKALSFLLFTIFLYSTILMMQWVTLKKAILIRNNPLNNSKFNAFHLQKDKRKLDMFLLSQ